MYKYVIFLLFFFVPLNAQVIHENEPFTDGDKVCFIGNSITHGGKYHSLIYLYYLTRFPEKEIKFFNNGASGGKANGAISRMELDILSHAPSRATIMFGMNDVGYVFNANPDSLELENRRKAIEDYKKNIDTLIMQLTEAGIKVTLLSPTIYDETVKNKKRINVGKNAALKKCTYILEEKAARFGTSFVNFYNILDSINNSRQSLDSAFTIVGEDRTHPGIDGHFVMTYQFLISQDVPSLVSEFVLDASKMEIVKKQYCNLLKIRQLENGIAFTLLEKALPFPYPNELVANEWVPFEKMLNNQILKITNLRSGQYYVKIDETVIDTFSAKQLHNGINLVKYDHTPQYIQANLVAQINEYRRIIEAERIRSLSLMEYGWLKDNPDASIDEKEILLKEKLDPHKEAGWYSYMRTQADNFIFYKPLEESTWKQLEALHEVLYRLNKPIPHKYLIGEVINE